jgi:hypothetical protein
MIGKLLEDHNRSQMVEVLCSDLLHLLDRDRGYRLEAAPGFGALKTTDLLKKTEAGLSLFRSGRGPDAITRSKRADVEM